MLIAITIASLLLAVLMLVLLIYSYNQLTELETRTNMTVIMYNRTLYEMFFANGKLQPVPYPDGTNMNIADIIEFTIGDSSDKTRGILKPNFCGQLKVNKENPFLIQIEDDAYKGDKKDYLLSDVKNITLVSRGPEMGIDVQ